MRVPVTTESAPPTRAAETAPPPPTGPIGPADVGPSAPFSAGAVGIGVVWLAVVVISVFAHDLVTGTEQTHIPITALITWVWGAIASRSLVISLRGERGRPHRFGSVWLLTGDVAAVWVVAAAVAVLGPEMVTSSGPTVVPICALLAPIAAMVLTTTGCQLFDTLDGTRPRP